MLIMLAMLVRRISPGRSDVTTMASGRVSNQVLHQFNDLLDMSNPDRGAVWGLKRTGGREFQTGSRGSGLAPGAVVVTRLPEGATEVVPRAGIHPQPPQPARCEARTRLTVSPCSFSGAGNC